MAHPLSRISTRRRWMNSMPPMSTPRVGCATSNSLGPSVSSRPITSFCWLPPERARAGSVRSGGRTSYSVRMRRAAVVDGRPDQPGARRPHGHRRAVGGAEDAVLGEVEVEQQAAAVAVLGHVGDAAVAAGARVEAAHLLVEQPHAAGDGAARPGRRGPRSARSGRCPRCRRRRRSRRRAPRARRRRGGGGRPRRPASSRVTASTGAAGFAGGFSTRSSTSRPTIRRASSAAEVSAVLRLPTTLPSRITVTSSEMASTSESLWVTMTTVLPCSRICRRMANSSPTACGLSTAVGSSRMSSFASR